MFTIAGHQAANCHVVMLSNWPATCPCAAITRTHFMYIFSLFCASSKQTSSNRRAYLGDYPLQWVQPYSVFIRYCTSLKRKCAALYISTWPYQWGYGHGDPPQTLDQKGQGPLPHPSSHFYMTCMGAEGLQCALQTATAPLLQRFRGNLCIPPPQYHLLTFHEHQN